VRIWRENECNVPILLEVCVVADDGGSVDALLLPDFVGAAVGS